MTANEITVKIEETNAIKARDAVTVGSMANELASGGVFADYREGKAASTIRRQSNDLARFADYLTEAEAAAGNDTIITADELVGNPQVWAGITWGLVTGFRRWLLAKGYAIGTVNISLSTVRTYSKLAHKAGTLPSAEYHKIRDVGGYSQKEGRNANAKRDTTRRGSKKRDFNALNDVQLNVLYTACDLGTAQGARDALMLALMADHGLRCGEAAGLTRDAIDTESGTLEFYREKVDKTQTHNLTAVTLKAALSYFDHVGDMAADEPLLKPSRRGGALLDGGISKRAITKRVRKFGRDYLGMGHLSAHDLRHTWATRAAKAGTSLQALQQAGGWASLAMPARYIEAAEIANEGVKLR